MMHSGSLEQETTGKHASAAGAKIAMRYIALPNATRACHAFNDLWRSHGGLAPPELLYARSYRLAGRGDRPSGRHPNVLHQRPVEASLPRGV